MGNGVQGISAAAELGLPRSCAMHASSPSRHYAPTPATLKDDMSLMYSMLQQPHPPPARIVARRPHSTAQHTQHRRLLESLRRPVKSAVQGL